MSLSFPILLSAVPLFLVDFTRKNPQDRVLERCWFSDGGISSNCPIHFFDRPLPCRPTFAIDLREKHPDFPPGVWMPNRNSDGVNERWNRFESHPEPIGRVLAFLGAIFDSIHNWSDNTLSRLPAYRDRIAHVQLAEGEGGLNLNMPPALIKALTERGAVAGSMLRERFAANASVLNWTNHRRVRLRSLLAALEETLTDLESVWDAPEGDDADYPTLVDQMLTGDYHWASESQGKAALRTLSLLVDLGKELVWEARVSRPGHLGPDPSCEFARASESRSSVAVLAPRCSRSVFAEDLRRLRLSDMDLPLSVFGPTAHGSCRRLSD